jgi:hypothetical protein
MTGTRRAKGILLLLVGQSVALATLETSASAAEISRDRDLPPLKLLAGDLDTILKKAHSQVASANGFPGERESVRETVTVGVGGHEIEIPHFSLASSVGFPNVVFRFSYNYSQANKPISSVVVDLRDQLRRVSVSGQAADQVEALSNLLENNLVRYSTVIGGAMFRRIAGVCLSVALLISLIASSAYGWKTRRHGAIGMPICSALGLVLLFRLPWERYLSGFALYQSYSPFFLVRHAPQVALLALAGTVVGIPLSYFLSQRER